MFFDILYLCNLATQTIASCIVVKYCMGLSVYTFFYVGCVSVFWCMLLCVEINLGAASKTHYILRRL